MKNTKGMIKSTVQEITKRFDNDVARFSNLETGQQTTIDAQLSLELITEASKRLVPNANKLLDVGCGAGNYTLKMLSKLPNLECTMVDLSKPMLDKANERVAKTRSNQVVTIQGDIRNVDLLENHYDIILAGAVLHHLREDEDWEATFTKLYRILKPGGCLMISDLVTQEIPELSAYTWERYGDYLEELNDLNYRKKVLDYVAFEDSPRSINYQIRLMEKVGFRKTEILHKNMCFGAFGGVK